MGRLRNRPVLEVSGPAILTFNDATLPATDLARDIYCAIRRARVRRQNLIRKLLNTLYARAYVHAFVAARNQASDSRRHTVALQFSNTGGYAAFTDCSSRRTLALNELDGLTSWPSLLTSFAQASTTMLVSIACIAVLGAFLLRVVCNGA